MSPIQTLLVSILLAVFSWQVWKMVITGARLSVGQPEDESDERWTRAFLGSIAGGLGGVLLLVPDLVIRTLALVILVGGVVLLLSGFFPRLRRRRN